MQSYSCDQPSGRHNNMQRDNYSSRWSSVDDGRQGRNSNPANYRSHAPSSNTSHTPSSTTTSNNRWMNPKGRSNMDICKSGGGGSDYKNKGQRGGGKVSRQRRHTSNDTHKQRMLTKKNIISPDSSTNPQSKNSNNNTNVDDTIPKLDPDNPVHAKRIQQRRRQVMFGRNTAGYEEYIKQIPKNKRRKRSSDCPMTPDYLLDIPTKRWQGLMNAWRRALHKFDPPDLHLRQPAQNTITLAPRPYVTQEDKQQEEIAQAKASGLQVAFGSMGVGSEANMFSINVAGDEETATATKNDGNEREDESKMGAAFDEEAAYQQSMDGGIGLEQEVESDSDDDLL